MSTLKRQFLPALPTTKAIPMHRDPIFDGLESDDLNSGKPAEARDYRGQLTNAADVMRYALAGKSTLTLVSLKTGARFTYRLSANDDATCHFVGVLTGPDNATDYSYLGRIARGIFWQGRKVPKAGDVAKSAPSSIAFEWAWRALAKGAMPAQLQVWHEGACGRCGRKLTVPESVASGFGPECRDKIGM